jgi:rsbT co-antagonist protein RsbR
MRYEPPPTAAHEATARRSPYNHEFEKEQDHTMSDRRNVLYEVLDKDDNSILQRWIDTQLATSTFRADRMTKVELAEQSRRFVTLLKQSLSSGSSDIHSSAWANTRQFLEELSLSRARQGFTPTEAAMFVFSLKDTLFDTVRARVASDPRAAAEAVLDTNQLLDKLGLFTIEVFQKGREQLIIRQQQELMELSTPVVTLWEGLLALPVIGTLDSDRTQVVMESLLQRIVETGARIAIIDITGVPTVDTLTAQHLLKTVAAARLMGADCIISGIRPQIAQTIVHLGVDLGTVITKATLADAFAIALRRLGLTIQKQDAKAARHGDGERHEGTSERTGD